MPYSALDTLYTLLAPACKIFLKAQLTVSDEKTSTTSGESITSSISCAKLYLEDAGTNTKKIAFFWYCEKAQIKPRVTCKELIASSDG